MPHSPDEKDREAHWREAQPEWNREDDAEGKEGVVRLLAAGRLRAPFDSAKYQIERLPPARVFSLLSEMAEGSEEGGDDEEVREVMDDLRARPMMQGVHTSLDKDRGPTWRGEGGGQERDIADAYCNWSSALKVTHPVVASELLVKMAKNDEQDAAVSFSIGFEAFACELREVARRH